MNFRAKNRLKLSFCRCKNKKNYLFFKTVPRLSFRCFFVIVFLYWYFNHYIIYFF